MASSFFSTSDGTAGPLAHLIHRGVGHEIARIHRELALAHFADHGCGKDVDGHRFWAPSAPGLESTPTQSPARMSDHGTVVRLSTDAPGGSTTRRTVPSEDFT